MIVAIAVGGRGELELVLPQATSAEAPAQPAAEPLPEGACRLRVDLDLCQGHGVCVNEAPEVFDIEPKERKVVLVQTTPGREHRARVELAVQHCPTRALSIEE